MAMARALLLLAALVCLAVVSAQRCTFDLCVAEAGCGFDTTCRKCSDLDADGGECAGASNCYVKDVSGTKSCDSCDSITVETDCSAARTGGGCLWDVADGACKSANEPNYAKSAATFAFAAAAAAAAFLAH